MSSSDQEKYKEWRDTTATHRTVTPDVRNKATFKVALGKQREIAGHCADMEVKPTRQNNGGSKYRVELRSDTITMEDPRKEEWLRSSEYLDALHYPYIRFESTEVVRDKQGQVTVFGLMTIRNIIREVSAQITSATIVIDPFGRIYERVSFRVWIDRRTWGLLAYKEEGESTTEVSHQVLIEGQYHRRVLNFN
jgi:polyisoprenoid-binding protein YceI